MAEEENRTTRPKIGPNFAASRDTSFIVRVNQCCQMAYFQTKNTNLGKFWMVV
jgi:hypothetical protein